MIKRHDGVVAPTLTLTLKKMSGARLDSEGRLLDGKEAIYDLVKNSIFYEFVKDMEVFDQAQIMKKENSSSQKVCMRIVSDHTCVISGLKTFLTEQAQDLLVSISEDFFNIQAKPFKPKAES